MSLGILSSKRQRVSSTAPVAGFLPRASVIEEGAPGPVEGDMVGASIVSVHHSSVVDVPALRLQNYTGLGVGPLVVVVVNEATPLIVGNKDHGTSSVNVFQNLADRTDWGFVLATAGYYQGSVTFMTSLSNPTTGVVNGEWRFALNGSVAIDSRMMPFRARIDAKNNVTIGFAGDFSAGDRLTPMFTLPAASSGINASSVDFGSMTFQAIQFAA